jgi:hypothetical protein
VRCRRGERLKRAVALDDAMMHCSRFATDWRKWQVSYESGSGAGLLHVYGRCAHAVSSLNVVYTAGV